MKFSCGRTFRSKWLKAEEKAKKEVDKYGNWHKWFAWYPVTISEKDGKKQCVWLQMLERRWVDAKVQYKSLYSKYPVVWGSLVEYREVE